MTAHRWASGWCGTADHHRCAGSYGPTATACACSCHLPDAAGSGAGADSPGPAATNQPACPIWGWRTRRRIGAERMKVDATVGYVVVEFNQASHEPNVLRESFTDDRRIAVHDADQQRQRVAAVGRRERYAVAEVVLDEDPS